MGVLNLNFDQIYNATDKFQQRSLQRASAYVRKVAMNSIKKSKKKSEVGTPPHTRKGNLKKAILYKRLDNTMYVVGVLGEMQKIANLHEGGGVVSKIPKQPSGKLGDWSPIRIDKNGKPVRIQSKSYKQVMRGLNIYKQYLEKRYSAKYKPRPFMHPALKKSLPNIGKMFNK